MDSKKRLLINLLILVLLIIAALVLYKQIGGSIDTQQLAVDQAPVDNTNVAAGEDDQQEKYDDSIAPDFKMFDLSGNEYRLHDYLGKPIVLNFWASWCGPCQMEMPEFEQAYNELGDDVNFLMVNMTDGSRETVETASKFIEELGYTFPVFYDTAQEAAYTYAVYSLPTTYFIDAEGNAVAYAKGAINAETLQKGIDAILP